MSFDTLCNPFSVLRHVHPRAAGRVTYIEGIFGGGGQATPTDQTITQTNIPAEFKPYYERLLGRTEAESLTPYQPYKGSRIAPESNYADINKSQDLTRKLVGEGTPGITEARNMTRTAAGRMLGLSDQDPYKFSQYGGFQAGKASPFAGFSEADYNEYAFGPAGQFTGSAVGQYMDPYMQQVVDVEKRRAQEDYKIAQQGRNYSAVQAGAFGGSRQGVQEGMAERDLLERQGAIQSRGLSTAYGDAQSMFEADRAARMSTEQARAGEAARVQTGVAGEAARVQEAKAAELARTQGISIEEAARVQAGKAAELARVQGAQAGENRAADQFGLDALQAYSGEAEQLAGLSEQERAAKIQNAQLLDAIGRGKQGEGQAGLDIGYQDWLRQQGYPMEQLGNLSNILQGVPIANAGTTTQTGSTYTNPMQQALGAGLGAVSLYKAFT